MKILQLTADWKWTGPAEPMLHAVTGLRERGHEVHAAFPEPPAGHAGALAERAAARGVEPVQLLARGQGYVPLRDAGEVRRLRALLGRERYDVVHAHHTRDQLLARRALPRGTRLVWSWHRGEPLPARWWSRWLLGPGGADGLVVLSEALRDAACVELGWPPGRVAVVPGCVDTERFRPRPPAGTVRKELGLGEQERAVGLVARLQPHRRVELLLEALVRARPRAPQLRLVVIGRGTRARQVLDEPVARLGLDDVVIRAGYRRDDYLETLSVLDGLIFLVPGSDGSCRAVLEAMAMGLPVISTRRGVLPETVLDGVTGRLVDEDPDAIADALVDLALDPRGWGERGERGRRRALERHTVPAAVERLEQLYAALAGE